MRKIGKEREILEMEKIQTSRCQVCTDGINVCKPERDIFNGNIAE